MSAGNVDTGERTFTAGEAIGQYILVKYGSGVITIAAITEEPIGVTKDLVASGGEVAVWLFNKPGTLICTADAAITSGAVVYGQNAGKVDDDSGSSALRIGLALQAAAADGDEIEVVVKPYGGT